MSGKPRRFYCPGEFLPGAKLLLPGDEAAHLTRVLRLGVGAAVRVFDGLGSEFLARVVSVERGAVELLLEEPLKSCPEPGVEIILGLSLFARDRLRFTVQKGVELGVREIRLVRADRSVRALGLDREGEKLASLQKVAREAAKQCGRNVVPEVRAAVGPEEFAASLPAGCLKLLFHEKGDNPGLRDILSYNKETRSIAGLIGPEGGLGMGEVELLKEHGFLAASLGPRILRVETAALFFLCAIQYELGDMGFPLTSENE